MHFEISELEKEGAIDTRIVLFIVTFLIVPAFRVLILYMKVLITLTSVNSAFSRYHTRAYIVFAKHNYFV